ncbi:MAG: MarR family transcriptional regulator [Bradymonadia bacterium]
MSWWSYGPQMSAAEKRAQAEKEAKKLAKRLGVPLQPAHASRKIAKTFWGEAWCDNLERYSDLASRLPRGRTYARNGSIIHLSAEGRRIKAYVSGNRLYQVDIEVQPLAPESWQALRDRCAGQIDSAVELLKGALSSEVMAHVVDPEGGLFPEPSAVSLCCSCPDWASMCKHVAAVLYGVGHRLDTAPELLFALRGVDHTELVRDALAQGALASLPPPSPGRRVLAPESLSAIFGADIDLREDALEAQTEPNPHSPPSPEAHAPRGEIAGPEAQVSRRALLVLEYVRAHPGLSKGEIGRQLVFSNGAVSASLKELKAQGLVVYRGGGKNGGYHPVDG